MAGPRVTFLFSMANDLEAIRAFYGDVLGCEYKGSPKEGWLNLKTGIDTIFFQWDTPTLPVIDEWAWQPGYKGGPGSATSWVLNYDDEASFRDAVRRVKEVGAKTYQPVPEWRRDCYWGHSVKDPMGNTVELCFLRTKPDSLEWTD